MTEQAAIQTHDVIRQIALEYEIDIISGKVSSDHVHLFAFRRPTRDISKIIQWLRGISSFILFSEFQSENPSTRSQGSLCQLKEDD